MTGPLLFCNGTSEINLSSLACELLSSTACSSRLVAFSTRRSWDIACRVKKLGQLYSEDSWSLTLIAKH